MEKQFILRLPENLSNSNPLDLRLVKKNSKEVKLYVKGKEYPGIICRIPTIIETQKCINSKLYKIADVYTLIVIYEKGGFDVEQEIRKHELSGLTPPMSFVKERRFSATNIIRTEEIEEIERKVEELLIEDAKAFKVEIVGAEKESSELDIDLFAAELENEIPKKEEKKEHNMQDVITDMDNITGINNKQNWTDKPTKKTDDKLKLENVEHGKTYETPLQNTSKGMDDIAIHKTASHFVPTAKSDETQIESNQTELKPSAEPAIVEQNQVPVSIQNEPSKDPILLELEEKIKEKEALVNKSVNPILKKRFEQAVKDLKAQFEKRKEELNK